MTVFHDRPNLFELHARERTRMPSNWYAWLYEVKECPLGKWFEITGAVCPITTKGPRKGRPNYNRRDKSTQRTVAIPVAEHSEWLAKWEQENDSCRECYGTGQQLHSISVDRGVTYKPCKCGRSPVAAVEQPSLLEQSA